MTVNTDGAAGTAPVVLAETAAGQQDPIGTRAATPATSPANPVPSDRQDAHPVATVPERLFRDPAAEARWRRRFTAVRLSLPDPARDEPDHAVYYSNASGRFELVTWDAAAGTSVQATDRPDGTVAGTLSADGRSLWWFDDTGGDEFGSWRCQPFGTGAGGTGSGGAGADGTDAALALPDVPPGYPAGVAVGRTLAIAGFSDDDGTRVHLAADGHIVTVYQHEADGAVGALSTDETIWVLAHSEHGDSRYPALRALRVEDGSVIGELDDTPGKGLEAIEFSPVAGDQRLLVGHERRGRDELGIWNLDSGEFTELDIDLPGDVTAGFYPDGTALLVVHTHAGRATLHRYELATGTLAVSDGSLHAPQPGPAAPRRRPSPATASLTAPDGSLHAPQPGLPLRGDGPRPLRRRSRPYRQRPA